jgi:hypothetical protein
MCVFDPTSETQEDRHRWLHDEAQSARPRETGQYILKKALGEQIRITGVNYLGNGTR